MDIKELNKKLGEQLSETNPWGYDTFPSVLHKALMSVLGKTLTSLSYSDILIIRHDLIGLGDDFIDYEVEEPIIDEPIDIASNETIKFKKELEEKLESIDDKATTSNIIKYLQENNIEFLDRYYGTTRYIVFNEMAIVFRGKRLSFIMEESILPQWIEDAIVYKGKRKTRTYKYVIYSSHGFDTRRLAIKDMDIDVAYNYNDDMPDKEIKEFLNGKDSGIAILHGEPGTGKSTYIRHLISDIKKDFLYLDISCFDNLSNASFLELLLDNRDSIIILEDSEQLLKKRENSRTNIANLLNLTDGLLADTLNLKFICTFNAKLDDIDEALLRKGRLKIKYKFGKLETDKVAKLFNKLELVPTKLEPMTLADVYNFTNKVDYDKKERKQLGFVS